MTEQEFYTLIDAFSQARQRGEYTGDDATYLAEDMSGVIQILSSGEDIPTMYRALLEPILRSEIAALHPTLQGIYDSSEELQAAEADRAAAEAAADRAIADRAAAEERARASEETARQIRQLLGV